MTKKELRDKYTKETGEDLLEHPDWYAWWLETYFCYKFNEKCYNLELIEKKYNFLLGMNDNNEHPIIDDDM